MGQKYYPKISVLVAAKSALDQHHVLRQELICLLDSGVFGIARVLGEGGGKEHLDIGVKRCVSRHDFRTNC